MTIEAREAGKGRHGKGRQAKGGRQREGGSYRHIMKGGKQTKASNDDVNCQKR
jgi:hypothetical protein